MDRQQRPEKQRVVLDRDRNPEQRPERESKAPVAECPQPRQRDDQRHHGDRHVERVQAGMKGHVRQQHEAADHEQPPERAAAEPLTRTEQEHGREPGQQDRRQPHRRALAQHVMASALDRRDLGSPRSFFRILLRFDLGDDLFGGRLRQPSRREPPGQLHQGRVLMVDAEVAIADLGRVGLAALIEPAHDPRGVVARGLEVHTLVAHVADLPFATQQHQHGQQPQQRAEQRRRAQPRLDARAHRELGRRGLALGHGAPPNPRSSMQAMSFGVARWPSRCHVPATVVPTRSSSSCLPGSVASANAAQP